MTDREEEKLEERIKALPIEEAFPQADYNALVKQGANPKRVALLHALRDEIPPKPISPFCSGKTWLQAEIEIAQDVAEALKIKAEIEEEMPAEERKYDLDYTKFAREWADYAESGIKEEYERQIEDYVKRTIDVIDQHEWLLQDLSFSPAVRDAIADAEHQNIPLMEALQSAGASNHRQEYFLAAWATRYICSGTLRTELYEHYGHGVSFKPLYAERTEDSIEVWENPENRGCERVVTLTDFLGECPGHKLILDIKPGGGIYKENKNYFSWYELHKIVHSPQIQKWYERELEKSNEKSKEQENEREEELEEDLDNGIGY